MTAGRAGAVLLARAGARDAANREAFEQALAWGLPILAVERRGVDLSGPCPLCGAKKHHHGAGSHDERETPLLGHRCAHCAPMPADASAGYVLIESEWLLDQGHDLPPIVPTRAQEKFQRQQRKKRGLVEPEWARAASMRWRN